MGDNIDFSAVDKLLEEELRSGTFPGAAAAVLSQDEILYKNSLGWAQKEPVSRKLNYNTIFGLASLTKVIVTTSAVMKLIEMGKINLYDYLSEYFPKIPDDKEEMTIFHLLTHSSGFQPIVELWTKEFSYQEKIKYILNLNLENKIGEVVNYSDPNFILLGELVQRVSGKNLNDFSQEFLFEPLEMRKTTYNPLVNLDGIQKNDIAAAEYCSWRERMIIGEVHDENAYSLGGISGHAGLFSTLDDLLNFVQMLLNKGKFNNKRIFSSRTIEMMSQNWTKDLNQNRGLGWDLSNNFRSSAGVLLSDQAYGHTGFTGTSIWIAPELKIAIILLTNRVHPSRENIDIISLRPRLHNLIAAIVNNHKS